MRDQAQSDESTSRHQAQLNELTSRLHQTEDLVKKTEDLMTATIDDLKRRHQAQLDQLTREMHLKHADSLKRCQNLEPKISQLEGANFELTRRLQQAKDELIIKEESMKRYHDRERSLALDREEKYSQLRMELQGARDEKEETMKRAGERCHNLERSLKDQNSSIFKLQARIEELESFLRQMQTTKSYTEEYREQVARVGELEALLRTRAAEVEKLHDEIMKLTRQLNEVRTMQSPVHVEPPHAMVEPQGLPVTLHTRVKAVAPALPRSLLETAMADASSGFRLIEGRQVTTR